MCLAPMEYEPGFQTDPQGLINHKEKLSQPSTNAYEV